MGCRHDNGFGASDARAHQGAAAAPAIAGRRRTAFGRRKTLHGRQRWRAHGVGSTTTGTKNRQRSIRGTRGFRRSMWKRIGSWCACITRRGFMSARTPWAIARLIKRSIRMPRCWKETPTHGLRHSIIHSNIPTDHALDTMATLQKQYDAGYPELQAPFLWWIGDTYAGTFGPARAARLIPLKTMVTRGIVFGGGSDYFVTPFAARYGIWASVARETLKGVYGAHPFGTAEAVSRCAYCAAIVYGVGGAPAIFGWDRRIDRAGEKMRTSRFGIKICIPCRRA